jgi:hypothetical protein
MSEPLFNPFGGPFAGAPGIGGNPLDDEANMGPRCPKCKSTNFHAWTTDYGISRRCLEASCGEEWSGGSVAVARPMFSDPDVLADGTLAPDIDIPVVQYTGASYRDPSKTFGDDEW